MNDALPLITQPDLSGKRILTRVDFNATTNADDRIIDSFKIKENAPTINYIAKKKTKIILLSHRSSVVQDGKKITPSFKPLIGQIENLLKHRITLLDPLDLAQAQKIIKRANFGEIFFFDNTRLHPAEVKADIQHAKALAKLGDVLVYDAFASYRPETTTVVLPRFLPTYIGFTMQQEMKMLSAIFKKPRRPLVCIIGGAKTEVKVGIVRKFLQFADTIVLGGSVANTFLTAWGIHLGASLVDHDMVATARDLLWQALHSRVALELPHDFIVGKAGQANVLALHHTQIASSYAAFDIGPATRKRYQSIISRAGTIVWNGPMGKYEDRLFRAGTLSVLDAIIQARGKKIVGGGDTITSLPKRKRKALDHVSTGGGAMLVFLESGTTPPIEAIKKYGS